MAIKKDPKSADVDKDLTKLLTAIIKNKNRIQLVGYNNMRAKYIRRIFNNGKATSGVDIGQYARATKIFRNKVGRRVDKVDLELTSTLRKSIVIGKNGDELVLGFRDLNEPITEVPKVGVRLGKGGRLGKGTLRVVGRSNLTTEENAIKQEKNFNKEIFAPSQSEINQGDKAILKEINIIVKQALKGLG